MKKRSW